MTENTPNGKMILEHLNWRYATKAFDAGKKVSDEDWETLENALLLAPSSFGIQPYKFIVVTDPAIREKLKPAAWGQTQVTDSSHLVVFAYKKTLSDADIDHYVERIVEVRGAPRESLAEYEGAMKNAAKQSVEGGTVETWNSRQAYIALGFLLETAALLKIDATPMEGFDAVQFNEILGLEDYSAVVICAVGYRNAEADYLADAAKVRFPREELIQRI
ncbi:MAG: NAD(P)H-dependent oxidoreductase [Pyrinomonadaceae bacterium]|nr:NAD(P)H-dependent oxidoreductase [Pyrinomonadaceae bacterium]